MEWNGLSGLLESTTGMDHWTTGLTEIWNSNRGSKAKLQTSILLSCGELLYKSVIVCINFVMLYTNLSWCDCRWHVVWKSWTHHDVLHSLCYTAHFEKLGSSWYTFTLNIGSLLCKFSLTMLLQQQLEKLWSHGVDLHSLCHACRQLVPSPWNQSLGTR